MVEPEPLITPRLRTPTIREPGKRIPLSSSTP
jgi:hypothetical protein